MNECKNLLFVLFDGIENSVFGSMVLQPLQRRMAQQQDLHVTLVSFQSKMINDNHIKLLTANNQRLHVIVIPKIVPWGNVGLNWYGLRLALMLCNKNYDEIVARGPFAGWIALKAYAWMRMFSKSYCPKIVVQARGLCGEEYRYMQQKKQDFGGWKKIVKLLRYWLLARKERRAYQLAEKVQKKSGNVVIESVSEALKTYITDRFYIDPSMIIIAHDDRIMPAKHCDIDYWRRAMRAEFGIDLKAYVYCYSGSYKPWQCVEQTIDFFKQQHEKDENTFLIIFSADKQAFEKHLVRVGLDRGCWRVLSAPTSQLLEYLAVANAGILLRDSDIINWVSRPTKMLEYQAVGLEIIHNNTVECLVESKH